MYSSIFSATLNYAFIRLLSLNGSVETFNARSTRGLQMVYEEGSFLLMLTIVQLNQYENVLPYLHVC
jgi:hypothetical protein